MMLVRTYLASSAIEGLGVYADEYIPSGTLIWNFNPKFVATFSQRDIEKLPVHTREFVEKYAFPHPFKSNHLIVELDNGRFMNHSDEPNTDFIVFGKGYAIRDIAPGEEITSNYHEFDPTFVGGFANYQQPQNSYQPGQN